MAHLWLTVVIVTIIGVNANPKANNDPFQGFPFQQFPKITFPPFQIPTFPNFPNIPHFSPVFPTIPPIKIPSPEDIINKNVNPNEVYNGIVVQSSSGFVKDKDGNLVKTGGTTVVTNNNGDVQKYSVGKNPPPVAKVVPPFIQPKITIEKGMFAPIDLLKIPVIEPLPLFFPPIQPILTYDELKNIKPGKNQNFVGSSTSSFSVSSNINGKKNYVGGTNVIVNDNGKVDEQTVALQKNNEI